MTEYSVYVTETVHNLDNQLLSSKRKLLLTTTSLADARACMYAHYEKAESQRSATNNPLVAAK